MSSYNFLFFLLTAWIQILFLIGPSLLYSANVYVPKAKLIASDRTDNDYFGYSLSISGDTVVVTAIFDIIGTNGNQGSVFWVLQQNLWVKNSPI